MRRALVISVLAACQPVQVVPGGASGAPLPPAQAQASFAQGDKQAVQAALKDAGVELDGDACVAWPSSFPRVVVVGTFAHDRGCDTIGLFVDRRWTPGGDEVAGLSTRAFASAAQTDKESLARAWIDEVVHVFGGSFVTSEHVAFTLGRGPPYTPVLVRANKIDGVVVEGWEIGRSGMRDESTFTFATYRFAPDGRLTAETKQSFTVDGATLRKAEETPK